MSVTIETRSTLRRPAADVWARVTSESGIRDEMRPVLRMTMPPGLRGRSIDEADDLVGPPLGKAWLLLLGVLPVEYDDMVLAAVGPGHRFHERSRMLLLATWEHERAVVAAAGGGCEVRDRLTFTGRVRLVEPVARRVVTLLFAHRHRRLRRWDGGPQA